MVPPGLNLQGLRKGGHLVIPPSPFPGVQVLRLLGRARLSRRRLLQLAGATAVGAAAEMSPYRPHVVVRREDKVMTVLVDGVRRWTVDPARFSGSPQLECRIGTLRTSFVLSGAMYPGTDLPASLSGMIWVEQGQWLIQLALALGDFKAEMPLIDWLVRSVPASSSVNLGEANLPIGPGNFLRLCGRATGLFSPHWSLDLQGRSVAAVEGFGPAISSDTVTLSPPEPADPTLFREVPLHRSVLSLDGFQRNWKIDVELPPDSPWDMSSQAGTFDLLQLEFGESLRGNRTVAAVARSVGGEKTISFFPGSGLHTLDGSATEFLLKDPRYALLFDDDGREAALMGNWASGTKWVQADGIALELGTTSESSPFEMTMRNGTLTHFHAAPSLLHVAAPLSDPTIAAGPVPICGTPELQLTYPGLPGFFHRLKCWLGFCDKSELCVPMHGSRLSILRAEDLLRLDFEFVNLALQSQHGKPRLVRLRSDGKPAGEEDDISTLPEALIIAHFPPQNIFEQAYFFGGQAPCDPCDPDQGKTDVETPQPPIAARISGPSRLAFPIESLHIPYNLESLLDLSRSGMKLTATALPPGELLTDASVDKLKPRPPSKYETALELPYRLYVSPNRFAGWANIRKLPKIDPKTWTELWHTRLGIRSQSGIDEQEGARRTLRALWSVEYTDDPCLPPKTRKETNVPFRGTLSPRDRVELVELTSNFALKDPRDPKGKRPYNPNPVSADLVILSSLGAWLKSIGRWDPPVTFRGQALTVELWKHTATMGRDHYVRVEYKGFLMPFGYPCTLVKVTERKVANVPNVGPVAYLEQRLFITIKQEEKAYPAPGQQHSGLAWPFRFVHFEKGYTTPPLAEPCSIAAFWPQTKQDSVLKDHVFRYKLEDLDGNRFDCASPLKFVDATVAYSDCTFSFVQGKPCGTTPELHCNAFVPGTGTLAPEIAEYNNTVPATRRQICFGGRKVAYATSKNPGDTQFETDCMMLSVETKAEQYTCDSLFTADQAPIYPAHQVSNVKVASISDLTGLDSNTPVQYDDTYLENGFSVKGNRGEVFLKFANGPVQLTFGGGGGTGDKSGGLVTPNAGVVGLSRKVGTVGGSSETSLSVTASGNFDPSQFFSGSLIDARILGGIKLLDIITPLAAGVADNLGEAPKLIRRAISAAGDLVLDESKAFLNAATKINDIAQSALNQFPPLAPRFKPLIGRSQNDVADLSVAIQQSPGDTLALINAQGKVVADYQVIISQIEDVIQHPQVLLTDELEQWALHVTGLDGALAGPLMQLRTILADPNQAIDKLTDAIATEVIKAIENAVLAHQAQFEQGIRAAQGGLVAAVKGLPSLDQVERAIDGLAQILDRIDEFRAEVRQITDLAFVVGADLTTIKTQVASLGAVPNSALQAARKDVEAKLQNLQTSTAEGIDLRNAKVQLFEASQGIENLLQSSVVDVDKFVDAQLSLLRNIQTFLKLPTTITSPVRPMLMSWVSDFTCITKATTQNLKPVVDLLKLGASTGAQLKRLKGSADDIVSNVQAARAAFDAASTDDGKLSSAIDLLQNFNNGLGFLERATEVIGASGITNSLKTASQDLDDVIAKVEQAQQTLQNIKQVMQNVANAAPALIQQAISDEISALFAPIDQWATIVEEDAIVALAQVLEGVIAFGANLLKRLTPAVDKLSDVLALKKAIQDEILQLLVPKAFDLSYDWHPQLKSSPGGVFVLLDKDGNKTDDDHDRTHLSIAVRGRTEIAVGPNPIKPPTFSITGRLNNFRINLLGEDQSRNFIIIDFLYVQFSSANGTRPNCDVKIKNVGLGQALAFVKKIEQLLSPKEGPYVDISPLQVVAGFRFGIPSFSTGAFSISNIHFDAAIMLPLTGDPARFRFRLSSPDNPFVLSVAILGGGGWFGISLGLDGVDELEMALEFGLAAAISIGVATGSGRIMAGIYIRLQKGSGAELTGFVDIAGHVDVLGLISLTLCVHFGLRLAGGNCFGEADIVVKIEMFLFDIEVKLHTEKRFAGSSNAQLAVAAALLNESCPASPSPPEHEDEQELDWGVYHAAFAKY